MSIIGNIIGSGIEKPITAIGNAIDKIFTSDEERMTAKAILEKISQHPAELAHELEKLQLTTDAADRDSARKREVEVKDWMPSILSACVTIGFFGVMIAMMLDKSISSDYRDVLNIMTGSLGTAWIGVINYYFGSSASGRFKDKALAEKVSLPSPF